MKILGIETSVIILALISAFIGYQFNHRAKKREIFLKELNTSYHEVYSPMYRRLERINSEANRSIRIELISDFIGFYGQDESKIRYIGTSFNLERYLQLEVLHRNYLMNSGRLIENELLKAFEEFHISMKNEFWTAHDIIYEDHLKFKSVSNRNIFLVMLSECIVLLYNVSSFLFYASLVFVYFTLWDKYIHKIPISDKPEWFNISTAFLLLIAIVMVHLVVVMFYAMVANKNKRSSTVLKRIYKNIKSMFGFEG
ncbi:MULTISPECIES: hypothetical protein [Paenibacillus]|uniref:hypothetical protein n=1 Tax=Paenibacillus TaxID=44249 RepID=UPI0005EC2D6C|nr:MULTISPECIES: hypothetical protein [Paenibacillus]AUS27787.1 hypothetical protein C1A50_3623 [Paenibacillus polymyxa]KJK31333.1 hypothetical protein TY89_08075 [Paenibacillus polymyxa]RFT98994.1 hypothetical protein DX902_07295 [Paenibacillus jamilae]WOZ37077.1 hypothetical protein RQP19_17110 [Paenibacillus polymyxa]